MEFHTRLLAGIAPVGVEPTDFELMRLASRPLLHGRAIEVAGGITRPSSRAKSLSSGVGFEFFDFLP